MSKKRSSGRTTPKKPRSGSISLAMIDAEHQAVLRAGQAPRRDRVCISYISPGEVDTQFCGSLVSTILADANDRRVLAGHIMLESGPRIVEARSQVVSHFLMDPVLAPCDWLWCIDADMVWEPDALYRLLDQADELGADVIGGLCFAGGHSDRVYPTIYRLVAEDTGTAVEPVLDYARDAPIKVGATGAAFLLIRRSILERMTVAFGKQPDGSVNPYPWFVEGVGPGGRPFGEDVAFCMRVNALGGSVWVDPRVKIGHMKRRALTEAVFDTVPRVEARVL